MFTGIVEEFGKVLKVTSNSIAIECDIVIEDAKLGDSIAVNGICLTVVELMQKGFVADVSPETFRVSALSKLKSGDFVNIETDILGRYVEKFLSLKNNSNITEDFLKENGFY